MPAITGSARRQPAGKRTIRPAGPLSAESVSTQRRGPPAMARSQLPAAPARVSGKVAGRAEGKVAGGPLSGGGAVSCAAAASGRRATRARDGAQARHFEKPHRGPATGRLGNGVGGAFPSNHANRLSVRSRPIAARV